jgi:hypothetical protein
VSATDRISDTAASGSPEMRDGARVATRLPPEWNPTSAHVRVEKLSIMGEGLLHARAAIGRPWRFRASIHTLIRRPPLALFLQSPAVLCRWRVCGNSFAPPFRGAPRGALRA